MNQSDFRKLSKVLIVLAVVVLIALPYFYSLYVKSSNELDVKESPATYTWIHSFQNIPSNNPLFMINYSSSSSLILSPLADPGKSTSSSFNATLGGAAYTGGPDGPYDFSLDLTLKISGNMTSQLKPSGVSISLEPIQGSSTRFSNSLYANLFQTSPRVGNYSSTNVTSQFSTVDSLLKLNLYNQSGVKQNQIYHFSVYDWISTSIAHGLRYNATYGICITANLIGLSQPISDTFYLYFININENS